MSFSHIVIIFLIALVAFGPQKLPELARALGKAMAEFRKASSDLRSAMEEELREIDRHTRDTNTRAREALPTPPPAPVYDPDTVRDSNALQSELPPAPPDSNAVSQTSQAEGSPHGEADAPDAERKPA